MILLAAVCFAAAVWLAGETLGGRPLRLSGRSRRRRSQRVGQVWLSQAGAAVTPTQFCAVSAGLAGLAFLVLLAIGRTVIVAAIPALGVGAVPYGYWAAQRRRRDNARQEAWPDALRQVAGSVSAGISTLHEALVELAVSGPEPLRPAMGRYVRLADRVGVTAALEAVRAELADPVSDAVLLTFEVAAAEGTEVVLRVLDGLLGQVTGDLALAERIRTQQTQSRIAGWASLTLPYLLVVFLCASTPSYREFFDSAAGFAVLLGGAVVSGIGFVLIRRLAKPIATTQRVFATGRDPARPGQPVAVDSPAGLTAEVPGR